jgi:adenine-specific DNA-methyltransferase
LEELKLKEKVELYSEDIVSKRLDDMKKLFPEVFREGKVDFNLLKNILGEQVEGRREYYNLNWAGKKDCHNLIQSQSKATLQPVKEESVNFDDTENIFIEGDNLEVLKLLHKTYAGKVKMIYIDPPYNTGNDFVYNDDFKDNLQNYLRITGQVDDKGEKTGANGNRNGRFHSNWLNMMYPRLFFARNLLREDGVIFVSIDDNEVHNLRCLMDEVFGEENFIAMFVWKKRSGSNDEKHSFVSVDHEYLVVYKKDSSFKFKGEKKDFLNYSNPDNDHRGPWAVDNLTCNKTRQQRPNLYYDITDPETGNVYKCNPNRVWVYEKNRMERLINENKVIFPKDKNGRPSYKRHLNEVKHDSKPLSTWIEATAVDKEQLNIEQLKYDVSIMQTNINAQATKEVRSILEGQVFDYPKPVMLLKEIIKQSASGEDIIMDFFAGSGTISQAVMELNKEDGGNRKFILVQLPEQTSNEVYPTIADITKERIRRVIKKIEEEISGDLDFGEEKPDLGFKVFKLTPSNYKLLDMVEVCDTNRDEAVSIIKGQLNLMKDESLVPGYKKIDVVYENMIKEGYSLNSKVEEINQGSNTIYKVSEDKGFFYICLDHDVPLNILKGLEYGKDTLFMCLDSAIDDTVAVNLELQVRLKTI